MPHLFVYGTLMCDDIMFEVSGEMLSSEPVTLDDHSCRAVIQQPFPALISCPGESVNGLLFRDVSKAVWQRLDRFEGVMYQRNEVNVYSPSGENFSALSYMPVPEYMANVSDTRWDYNQFIASGRVRFESGYFGYDAL